jgi:hypothetical protein
MFSQLDAQLVTSLVNGSNNIFRIPSLRLGPGPEFLFVAHNLIRKHTSQFVAIIKPRALVVFAAERQPDGSRGLLAHGPRSR